MSEAKVQMNVRLPELQRRRLRILALQRGLNEEEAVLQALEVWFAAAQPDELPRATPQPRAPQERPAARGPRRPKGDAATAGAASGGASAIWAGQVTRSNPRGRAQPYSAPRVAAQRPESIASVIAESRRNVPTPERGQPGPASPREANASAPEWRLQGDRLVRVLPGGSGSGLSSRGRGQAPAAPSQGSVGRTGRATRGAADSASNWAGEAQAMADESRSSAGRSDNAAGSEDPQTWPQRALALDWSQCPAAEMIQTAQGRVWAFRGTQLPLWSLFRNMQLGHWVDEVLDNFPELNEELVVTVLNFAADRMYIPDL